MLVKVGVLFHCLARLKAIQTYENLLVLKQGRFAIAVGQKSDKIAVIFEKFGWRCINFLHLPPTGMKLYFASTCWPSGESTRETKAAVRSGCWLSEMVAIG